MAFALVFGVAATACQSAAPPTVGSCFKFTNGGAWTNGPVYMETRYQNVATAYPDVNGCVTFRFFGAANDYYRLRVYLPRYNGSYVIGVWHGETPYVHIGATGHTQVPNAWVYWQPY